MMLSRRGQSILEYTMIVTFLAVVFFYMSTGFKRGVQSLVKVTADQVGNQQNADQDFNDVQTGYMIGSNTETQAVTGKQTAEIGYIPVSGQAVYLSNINSNESYYTMTNTVSNSGFIQESQ